MGGTGVLMTECVTMDWTIPPASEAFRTSCIVLYFVGRDIEMGRNWRITNHTLSYGIPSKSNSQV